MSSEPAGGVPSSRSHATRIALWASGGFLLLQLGWLLVMPPAAGLDEFDHIYRASAVSMGHWKPASVRPPYVLARGGFLPVRTDIAEAAGPACADVPYTRPFNCRPYRTLGDNTVEVASGVDNYNPLFYAAMGGVARPFTGNTAIYVMRAVAVVVCAAAFAMAVYLTMMWSRTRWPMVAVVLAALPTSLYSASIATPNGANMIFGLLAWTAFAALVRGGSDLRQPAYAAMSVAVAVVASTHTLGLVWIGLMVLTILIHQGLRQGVEMMLPRSRAEAAAFLVATSAVVFELWWLWYARPNDPARPEGGVTGSPWPDILNSLVLWPLQAIGAYPHRDEPAPVLVFAVALVLLGAIVVVAVRALATDRRLARAAAFAMVVTVAVPVVLTLLTYHSFGVAWQGRYGMTYSAGLFVLAALALDRRGPRLPRAFVVVGVSAWAFVQGVGEVGVLDNERARHEMVAATGWWAPPTVLILLIGALAALCWVRAMGARRSLSLPAEAS